METQTEQFLVMVEKQVERKRGIKMEKICGKCKHNKYDQETKNFICNCNKSDEFGIYTAYDDHCDCWEEKNKLKKYNFNKVGGKNV